MGEGGDEKGRGGEGTGPWGGLPYKLHIRKSKING